MKKNFSLLFCALVILSIFSCRDEYSICTLNKDVNLIGGFYQNIGGNEITAVAPNLTIATLNATSTIYSNQTNISVFSFPLSATVDSAKYVFTIANNLPKDTLTIVYSSRSEVVSAECGTATYNNITKLTSTKNTIDSVKIVSANVNTLLLKNIKIYY
jgi:Family of unknown function (DUF6452)